MNTQQYLHYGVLLLVVVLAVLLQFKPELLAPVLTKLKLDMVLQYKTETAVVLLAGAAAYHYYKQ